MEDRFVDRTELKTSFFSSKIVFLIGVLNTGTEVVEFLAPKIIWVSFFLNSLEIYNILQGVLPILPYLSYVVLNNLLELEI